MSGRPSTLTALAGTFDWTGRSGRLAFALPAVSMLLALVGLPALIGPIAITYFLHAVLLFVTVSQLRRRIRDVGWRGWVMWLFWVPYVGLVLIAILAFRAPREEARTGENTVLRRVGFAGVVGVTLLILSRVFWEPFWVPSGSMKPTILVGDYLIALRTRVEPDRGALVVFVHPINGQDFIARVMAVEGDTLIMCDGIVELNGALLSQTPVPDFVEKFGPQGVNSMIPRCANGPVSLGGDCIKVQASETLPSGLSYNILDIGTQSSDNTPEYTVPDGHVFVMGDNRDNSLDSRTPQVAGGIGFVPVENVHSLARFVLFNFDGQAGRILKVLQ